MNKTSKAKLKANKKWDEKNKDRKNYINMRSKAKNFILKMADKEDLDKLEGYLQERKEYLKIVDYTR